MNKPGNSHAPRAPKRAVAAVDYHAPLDYALDVELFSLAELRRRVGDADARGLERISFHCLMYLSAGRCSHVVDFEREAMTSGSLLFLQPGQVHRFGDLADCEGWMLVFKAELLPTRADPQPHTGADRAVPEFEVAWLGDLGRNHLRLTAPTQRAVTETLERMADDAGRPPTRALSLLLRSQVQALLLRLWLDTSTHEDHDRIEPVLLSRYRIFRTAVERNFMRWHGVAPYAARLGCSEKSLMRAALEVSDRTAKTVITDRVVLEAKRLLAHTLWPVASIGEQLGFAEATNFVKFFRRETGQTPGVFRAELRGLPAVAGLALRPK